MSAIVRVCCVVTCICTALNGRDEKPECRQLQVSGPRCTTIPAALDEASRWHAFLAAGRPSSSRGAFQYAKSAGARSIRGLWHRPVTLKRLTEGPRISSGVSSTPFGPQVEEGQAMGTRFAPKFTWSERTLGRQWPSHVRRHAHVDPFWFENAEGICIGTLPAPGPTVNTRSTHGQHTVNIRSTYGQHEGKTLPNMYVFTVKQQEGQCAGVSAPFLSSLK